MANEAPQLPRSLVVLTALAVVVSALIALNTHQERDTLLPISIVAAAGLIGLALSARR